MKCRKTLDLWWGWGATRRKRGEKGVIVTFSLITNLSPPLWYLYANNGMKFNVVTLRVIMSVF